MFCFLPLFIFLLVSLQECQCDLANKFSFAAFNCSRDNPQCRHARHGAALSPAAAIGTNGVIASTVSAAPTTIGLQVPAVSCIIDGNCTDWINSKCIDNICKCPNEFPVRIVDHFFCKEVAFLNQTCEFDEQCLASEEMSKCSTTKICACEDGYEARRFSEFGETGPNEVNCVYKTGGGGRPGVDPAMIGVLAGLALMFIIICVVLRLFSKAEDLKSLRCSLEDGIEVTEIKTIQGNSISVPDEENSSWFSKLAKARFRENRSIFNTPNPRLMNASLFKDSKLLNPARNDRRGSRASVRVPSRAPSVTSVNKEVLKTSNGSIAKGRRGSANSTASGAVGSNAPPSAGAQKSSPKKEKSEETAVNIESVD